MDIPVPGTTQISQQLDANEHFFLVERPSQYPKDQQIGDRIEQRCAIGIAKTGCVTMLVDNLFETYST
jgi:hypothetical protein